MGKYIKICIGIILSVIVVSCFTLIIYENVRANKRDKIVLYYDNLTDYANLSQVEGVIVDINYKYNKADTVKIIFTIESDKIYKLAFYTSKHYVGKYEAYIGSSALISYDTKKFGNSWDLPIFNIRIGTKSIISYSVAKWELIEWIVINYSLSY